MYKLSLAITIESIYIFFEYFIIYYKPPLDRVVATWFIMSA